MAGDLQDLRSQIDAIDQSILQTLKKRNELVAQIGKVKKSMDVPVGNQELENQKLEKYTQTAEQLGVNQELVQNLFEEIFWDARRIQDEI
ncbi:MAG: chorismate mutase [Candidatus Peregrinibacteria bacterium]|nr:chorismate mutase [Candidatus Peregrinibacteria bacterium]MDZ4245117.1 chorismate mutase [Candidatus Gracilibacteria bacterium]